MALPPPTNEAFLREVDDELRRDQAVRLWQRWGRVLIGAVIVGLVALAVYLWWQNRQQATVGVEGETMAAALNELGENNTGGAQTKLAALSASQVPGYRIAAKLTLADIKLGKGDIKGAAAGYAEIANDATVAKPLRDAALIRQVSAEYDMLKPQDIVARLKPLAVSGNPWFGTAGEMSAIAYMRMGKPAQAGALFAEITRDETVPESIRSRSVQLAGVLGVDAPVPGVRNRN